MPMGLGSNDDDDVVPDGDTNSTFTSSVYCSICLELVADNGDRSWAKLQCGHQFHLDCIGSAFNTKGAMQCPNCRKIEKGQWLYGSRSYPELGTDDWTHDEDLYDLSYAEMSFGVHWCPFGNLTQFPSSFEEGEFSSAAYHDILGQQAMFAEHTAVSSASHPCPYIAYYGPIHSSNSGATVSEASNFNHWSGLPIPGDMPTSYAFPALDLHHDSWEHRSSHFSSASSRLGAADQPSVSPGSQRPSRGSSDIPRSGSIMHPFLVGHSSAARAGTSVASSMMPPYPGSNARARDRVQALQAYYQPPQPPNSTTMRTPIASGTQRFSSHNGSAQLASVASPTDQSGGFLLIPSSSSGHNFQEETHMQSRFQVWERDRLPSLSLNHVDRESNWRAYHQTASVSEPAVQSNSFQSRHGSGRMASQNR